MSCYTYSHPMCTKQSVKSSLSSCRWWEISDTPYAHFLALTVVVIPIIESWLIRSPSQGVKPRFIDISISVPQYMDPTFKTLNAEGNSMLMISSHSITFVLAKFLRPTEGNWSRRFLKLMAEMRNS